MKSVVLAVVVILFLPLYAAAQCTNYRPVAPVHKPVKEIVKEVKVIEEIVPIAIPVILPATVFQYIPAIQPQVIANPPVVPAAQQPQIAGTPDIDKLVRERVEAILREKFNGKDDGPPPLILPGQPTQQTAPAPADLSQKVAQLLANNCAKCHTAGVKVAGDVTLFVKKNEQLELRPGVSKDTILRVASPAADGTIRMPPTAKTDPNTAIKNGDLVLLRQWAAQP